MYYLFCAIAAPSDSGPHDLIHFYLLLLQIHYLDPPAIPVGHMLGFTGVNLPEDPRDIEAVFIGEQPCDLIDTASNDPYGTYTKEHTNPFRWIRCLPRQVPPGVYNVSVVVNSGTDGKAWRHSNSKYYGPGGRLIMLEVFPGEGYRPVYFLLLA